MPSAGSPAPIDNEAIVLKMMYGDVEGLRELLQAYGGKVTAGLLNRYGKVLPRETIDAVVKFAACKAFRRISQFKGREGKLGGWFYKIAVNAAIEALRGEGPSGKQIPENFDVIDEAASDPSDVTEGGEDLSPLARNLLSIIEKLPHQQRLISEADLAAGGSADAAILAKQLGTAKATVYVQRNNARKTIREEWIKHGYNLPHNWEIR